MTGWDDPGKDAPASRNDYAFNSLNIDKTTLTFVGGGAPTELEMVKERAQAIVVSAETADIWVSQGSATLGPDTVETQKFKG